MEYPQPFVIGLIIGMFVGEPADQVGELLTVDKENVNEK